MLAVRIGVLIRGANLETFNVTSCVHACNYGIVAS